MKIISQDKQFESDTLKGANNKLYALANKRTITNEDESVQYVADGILIESETDAKDAIKQHHTDTCIVTTESGKRFYADKESRIDLLSVVLENTDANNDLKYSEQWKTADGWVDVTVGEIREALKLATDAKKNIVAGTYTV